MNFYKVLEEASKFKQIDCNLEWKDVFYKLVQFKTFDRAIESCMPSIGDKRYCWHYYKRLDRDGLIGFGLSAFRNIEYNVEEEK
jgi:hypothetical protein